MDVLIFNPPRYRDGRNPRFNNAILWLASYLDQRGVSARVVPLTDGDFDSTIRREVSEHRPRVVAVACKWWDTLYAATVVAATVKSVDPSILTVAGGHTASFFASDLVARSPIDVVIRGDGEEPLRRLATGEPPLNCVFDDEASRVPTRPQYVQTERSLDEIELSPDLERLVSEIDVVNGYIWTGKGCTETCVYCSANAYNNMQQFGRARHIYRPADAIVREIEILSRYPGAQRLMFDFDPVRGPIEADYYTELFARLEKKRHSCYFFAWSLPSREVIRSLAETFHFVELSIDIQTGSDRLRRQLGGRFLKPYFSDEAILETLGYVEQFDNFMVDVSTLMGLPFETDADLAAFRDLGDRIYDDYRDTRYPYVSPMNVEPGSPLHRDPDRFEMVLFRRSFDDFLEYTRRSFEEGLNCYRPERYDENRFHPLGVCTRADFESGQRVRVFERWKVEQARVEARFAEKTFERVRKYREFGLERIGLVAGIDGLGAQRVHSE